MTTTGRTGASGTSQQPADIQVRHTLTYFANRRHIERLAILVVPLGNAREHLDAVLAVVALPVVGLAGLPLAELVEAAHAVGPDELVLRSTNS